MTARLDPLSYMRLPKLDVASALSLAKMLRQHVPEHAPPTVRGAASAMERATAALQTKWREQFVPTKRIDTRPLARQLGAAWKGLRDRLVGYSAFPENDAERRRAFAIHGAIFPDGLAFLLLWAPRMHAESGWRIATMDERFAAELEALVGPRFLAVLRASHRAYGDALGISKAVPLRAAPVLVADELRALVDAIRGYALQLLALAESDAAQHRAVVRALTPIDELRASIGRRVVSNETPQQLPVANAPLPRELRPTGSG